MRKLLYISLIFFLNSGWAQTSILEPIALLDDDPALIGIGNLLIDSDNRYILSVSGNEVSSLLIDPDDFSLSVLDSFTPPDCQNIIAQELSQGGQFFFYLCNLVSADGLRLGVANIDPSNGALSLLNNELEISDVINGIQDFTISFDGQNIYTIGSENIGADFFFRTYQFNQQASDLTLLQDLPTITLNNIAISPDGLNVYAQQQLATFEGLVVTFSRDSDGRVNIIDDSGSIAAFGELVFSETNERVYSSTIVFPGPVLSASVFSFSSRNSATGLLVDEQVETELGSQLSIGSLVVTNNDRLLLLPDEMLSGYRLNGQTGEYTLIDDNLNNGFAPIDPLGNFNDLLLLDDENLLYAVYDGGVALFAINDSLALDPIGVPTLSRQALLVVFALLLLLGWFSNSRRVNYLK